jgi:ABC-type protease/lipase transport system fused ATPase/permease subunit
MTRMPVQSAMLGLGAYLAIQNEISAGTIIATSILASRALSPIDQAISSWRGFLQSPHNVLTRDHADQAPLLIHDREAARLEVNHQL